MWDKTTFVFKNNGLVRLPITTYHDEEGGAVVIHAIQGWIEWGEAHLVVEFKGQNGRSSFKRKDNTNLFLVNLMMGLGAIGISCPSEASNVFHLYFVPQKSVPLTEMLADKVVQLLTACGITEFTAPHVTTETFLRRDDNQKPMTYGEALFATRIKLAE